LSETRLRAGTRPGFAVLLWLMSTLRREMASVAALDTASVMLTTALLVWYFVLGSGAWLGGGEAIEVLARLARPVCDLGLLFLGLAALLSVRRPPFVVVMTGGLFSLLAADVVYLWSRARGDYDLGMAEVFCAASTPAWRRTVTGCATCARAPKRSGRGWEFPRRRMSGPRSS
jgi:hypothetical protein